MAREIKTITAKEFTEMLEGKSHSEQIEAAMQLSKKQMLLLDNLIPEYEGAHWTKLEGAKYLVALFNL